MLRINLVCVFNKGQKNEVVVRGEDLTAAARWAEFRGIRLIDRPRPEDISAARTLADDLPNRKCQVLQGNPKVAIKKEF